MNVDNSDNSLESQHGYGLSSSSSSPQSQYSYGINSSSGESQDEELDPLSQQDEVLEAQHLPEAQEFGISARQTQHPPLDVQAEMPITTSPPVLQQDVQLDVSPLPKVEETIRNQSESEGKPCSFYLHCVSDSTYTDWEWGKPAPSSSNMGTQEGQGSTRQVSDEQDGGSEVVRYSIRQL
jgi:hypothetical protein